MEHYIKYKLCTLFLVIYDMFLILIAVEGSAVFPDPLQPGRDGLSLQDQSKTKVIDAMAINIEF